MKRVKKYLMLPAAVLLLAGMLTGCGKAEPDPNSGLYEAVSAKMMGMDMSVTELYENGVSFELQDGGKCVANLDGETGKMKWTTDGNKIHLEGGGVELDGTIGNAEMTLEDMMGMGVDMKFKCDELLHPELSGAASGEKSSDKDKDDKEGKADDTFVTTGSVLERLKEAKSGKNVYGGSGSAPSNDTQKSEQVTDSDDKNSNVGNDVSDTGSGDVSDIAKAKGLDASWFGPGTCDPKPLAEFYHHWTDELTWDEKEEMYGDFYDMIVEKAGCKPLDDNDDEYMDRAQFKYVTPDGGILDFYLTKTKDGGWEYGGISCAGDVLDVYHELEE